MHDESVQSAVEASEVAAELALAPKPERRIAFEMTDKRLRAAYLMADDQLTDGEIAAEIGVERKALYYWRREEVFRKQLAEYRQEICARILEQGIANKELRVRLMQDQLDKMAKLQKARAEHGRSRIAKNQNTDPGEETGLLAEIPTRTGTVGVFDAQLTREIRETAKYVAQELGQFQQKIDVTSGGQPIQFTIPMSDSETGEGGSDEVGEDKPEPEPELLDLNEEDE